MSQKRPIILLVDDNPRVRSFVRPALEEAGFDCLEAGDGWAALEKVETERPDLVVLDILLGDHRMSGLDVCKEMRQKGIRTPVIFLTIKDRTVDPGYMERAFQLGADDYITKREELKQLEQRMGLAPTEFLERKSDIEELVARIRARISLAPPEREFAGCLRINLAGRLVKVKRDGEWQEVHLTNAEFDILEALVKAAGRPVGKGQLMDAAVVDGEGSLQSHIWRLRNKIEPVPDEPRFLLVYHGIGYRFKEPDKEAAP